uniref:FLYWCH-type domain-containing protein n=1 Tax=Panagrellus redivivus TaxID=6233 RepID=A0A7E4UNI7_PANRE
MAGKNAYKLKRPKVYRNSRVTTFHEVHYVSSKIYINTTYPMQSCVFHEFDCGGTIAITKRHFFVSFIASKGQQDDRRRRVCYKKTSNRPLECATITGTCQFLVIDNHDPERRHITAAAILNF